MIKLDKIYTRGGDTGITSLGNGDRVKKDSLRVECYGEVDEINATIGVAICFCSNQQKKNLKKIQNELFDIGADLCMPQKKEKYESISHFWPSKETFLFRWYQKRLEVTGASLALDGRQTTVFCAFLSYR